MQHLDKTDWAYIAGILDGEGSISISKSFCYIASRQKRICSWGLKVIISNTDEKLIKWLQDSIGGLVCVSSRPGKRATTPIHQTKVCYRWTPSKHKLTKQFLLAVLPYMRLKREQAILALEFIALSEDGKNDCPAKRDELHQKCTILNSGKTVETNTSSTSQEVMRESELTGDSKKELAVTLTQ